MKQTKQMQINKKSFISCTLALLLILGFAGTAFAETRQFPISFYTDLVPATGGINTWLDPVNGNVLQIDTLGKRNILLNLGLPTTVTGKVLVTDLGDGTERVSVNIHTRNAICWGRSFNEAQGIFIPAFGYTPAAVQARLGPAALGDSVLRLVFSPQPVGQFNPNGAFLDSISTAISCDGLLRPESGFIAGTEGFAQTTQVGLFTTGVPAGCPPEGDSDCFPAEHVQFKVNGN